MLELTHWPLGDVAVSLFSKFQIHIKLRYLEDFLWNCPQVDATRPHRWLVNIGSGHGLVLSGNKPLPEQILTHHLVSLGHNELTAIPQILTSRSVDLEHGTKSIVVCLITRGSHVLGLFVPIRVSVQPACPAPIEYNIDFCIYTCHMIHALQSGYAHDIVNNIVDDNI